ncbi:phage antirepressor KilAC domain-containing protein [Limosilactobacillus pontis]|uniref:phage antirepressor KilAC domain-containing protein n=1 Tax=Limosilactobacillus pontis TaxID=35787 RepID=UPI002F261D00
MQPRLFNFHGQQVRTMIINDDSYFMGRDITNVLQYSNGPKAIRDHVDEEDKTVNETFTVNGTLPVLINESGLYSLILSSKLPTAREFKHWVTSEVLPTIRKHGAYMTPEKIKETLLNPDTIIKLATQLKQEQEQRKQLQTENDRMKPKALFADAVSTSNTSILIGQLAKILKQNGVDTGQNRLFAWMRANGYLGKRGDSYNKPTQKSMELGLMEVKERTVNNPDGSIRVTITTKVTGKGQQYFINKLLGTKALVEG